MGWITASPLQADFIYFTLQGPPPSRRTPDLIPSAFGQAVRITVVAVAQVGKVNKIGVVAALVAVGIQGALLNWGTRETPAAQAGAANGRSKVYSGIGRNETIQRRLTSTQRGGYPFGFS